MDIMFSMMSLRMKNGLNIDEFNRKYQSDFLSKYSLAIKNSNILIEDGFIKVKNLGILNKTLLDFME